MHLALLAVHLAYLPNTGNGDGYMSQAFQSMLLGNAHHREAALAGQPPPSFGALALEHLQTQFWYNRNMAILFPRGSHPFDTPWYTWPLAQVRSTSVHGGTRTLDPGPARILTLDPLALYGSVESTSTWCAIGTPSQLG